MSAVFISTGGFRNQTALDITLEFLNYGITSVELSGGAHCEDQLSGLIELREKVKFQVHNYFPPPLEPFVFNLASLDPEIHQKSMQHAYAAIRLAAVLGRPIYSFHAGFRINPSVVELGSIIKKRTLQNYDDTLDCFGRSMLDLAEFARGEGVKLLVENNVLTKSNFKSFGENPLLLTCSNQILEFIKEMPGNVEILLDVAHLKVSGTTLGFDYGDAHKALLPWIGGYHLSDNDGLEDSNGPVRGDSWFWGDVKPNLDYYTLEVYRLAADALVGQRELVLKMLKNN